MNTIKKELKQENGKINYGSQRVQVGPPRFGNSASSLATTVFNTNFTKLNFDDRFGLAIATFGSVKEVKLFCDKFNDLNVNLTLPEEPDIWILEASA